MTIFLDCEFNGFGGELISIAMVSDDGAPKHELYAVRKPPENPTPWVQEHVLPVLGRRPVNDATLQRQVLDYLGLRNRQTIVADWPEDLIHLPRLLSASAGYAYRLELTMRLVRTDTNLQSKIPHNALSDARALMFWHRRFGD